MKLINAAFWEEIAEIATPRNIFIDRQKGTPHPRHPEMIYPLDYGYIENTSASDGDGIDVWIGSLENKILTGILCTFDTLKRDMEIKILLGCSAQDVDTIINFHSQSMKMLYIQKPKE